MYTILICFMVFDYAKINAIAKNGEIEPVADQNYEIWNCKLFVKWIFKGEYKLCIYTIHLS